jgi:hypothetical protein
MVKKDTIRSASPVKPKASNVVKVDKNVTREPVLNLMEMIRILDARYEDMGLNKDPHEDKSNPKGLAKLIMEFHETGNGTGPAQRFRDYCEKMCNNRKLILTGF